MFVYGGDLWSAPRSGGTAGRLTATPEAEQYPRFSPDGKWIAFTRAGDVYSIPSGGGNERRLTWHPANDRAVEWTPDGASLLVHSDRLRGDISQNPHLFLLPAGGGLPEPLPIPRATHGSFSADGQRIAYGPNPEVVFWTPFKRYRGGSLGYIALYDPARNLYEELPRTHANDIHPMWHGNSIYFASDRGGVMNLYSYDLVSKQTERLTNYSEWDVKNPALGPDAIVFENAGWLYALDLVSHEIREIPVQVPADALPSDDLRTKWRAALDEVWNKYNERAFRPATVWAGIKPHYEELIVWAAHRSDAEYVLQEMLGEAAQSHIFLRWAGEQATPKTGLLGADFRIEQGLYRIVKIYRGDESNEQTRGPFAKPGVDVNEGDYVLAVNGEPLCGSEDIHAALQDAAGKDTKLTLAKAPGARGREIGVTPVANEAGLRYFEWVLANRARVAEASGGRVGYLHITNVDASGVQGFRREWARLRNTMSAIIVDARTNSGGINPEGVLECLTGSPLRIMYDRKGRVPPFGCHFDGPKVMISNDHAASGGDELVYFFRRSNAGPVIGTRTFGAMIGSGASYKIPGGWTLLVPEYGFWIPEARQWHPENIGAEPDQTVEIRPFALTGGRDPQLEAAIEAALKALKTYKRMPEPPPYAPVR